VLMGQRDLPALGGLSDSFGHGGGVSLKLFDLP
jgi:hypothetical protein